MNLGHDLGDECQHAYYNNSTVSRYDSLMYMYTVCTLCKTIISCGVTTYRGSPA